MSANHLKMSLQELFDEVRDKDITDPASMDAILAYYEELNEEAENYMEMLTEKLKYESINWNQPWYQLSHCLTRPLKDSDENHEDTFHKGTFTVDEIKTVEDNWCKFVKEYNIPNKLICVARWRNRMSRVSAKEKARVFVVAYLAQNLHRNLYQVYKFIVSHYGGAKRGLFSADEEKVLNICFYNEPKHAVVYASAVLARECRTIYTRLHESFEGKPPKGKTKWTLPMASKFLKLLMEYTGESLEGLKNKKIVTEVWLKLEKDFNKPKEYLRFFWTLRLYSQLFIKCHFTLRRFQRKIFRVLKNSPYKIWSDIRWKEVLTKFPEGFTVDLLYSKAKSVVIKYPNFCKVALHKLVDYALKGTLPNSRIRHKHKQFKTLRLRKNGTLKEVYYDTRLKVTRF